MTVFSCGIFVGLSTLSYVVDRFDVDVSNVVDRLDVSDDPNQGGEMLSWKNRIA